MGTTTFLTDANGDSYQFFLNLPFGETMAEQKSITQNYSTPFKFTGKELDEETGMYYFGARYYSPRESIWWSVDSEFEQGPDFSPYNYCFNNPLNLTDPDGNWPLPTGPIFFPVLKWLGSKISGSSNSSSRGSSIGGSGSGAGGIMLANSKGGSSGPTDLIRKGGRQGSDVMWGDASGFVQAGSFATCKRDGIKYNGSLKMVAKLTKETIKGLKIGNKIGEKLAGDNSTNSPTNTQSGVETNQASVKTTTSVNVFDSKIVTDCYGDPSNCITFERSVITPISVNVPDNKKSIDSVKAVYEKKSQSNTKKVNKQWE